MPPVYTFDNYRAFLKAYYEYRKSEENDFSYRVFAREAGFKSPNFLKLVIDGKRGLTAASLPQVCRALRLDPQENDFFRRLVAFNQAVEPLEKRRLAAELYQSEVFRALYPLKLAELQYYQQWFYIPIREMVSSPEFKEDGRWIARKLGDRISPSQAVKALGDLEALGLLKRIDGKLRLASQNVTTGSEVISGAVADFHRELLGLAAASIAEVPRHRREISASTLVLSEADFARFKTLVQDFRRSLLSQTTGGAGARVYHVAFQLFPLSDVLDEDTEDKCKKSA